MGLPVTSTWDGLNKQQLIRLVQQGVSINDQTRKLEVPLGKQLILIPNMFASFLPATPEVNPHYEDVKEEGERSICQILNANIRLRKTIAGCDFSYFQAICAPNASKGEYRNLCDWGNWVFPFDDLFDNGELRDDVINGQKLLDSLLSSMRDDGMLEAVNNTTGPFSGGKTFLQTLWSYSLGFFKDTEAEQPKHLLVELHNRVWREIVETAPKDIQRRFAKSMQRYATGIYQQVRDCADRRIPTVEEYMVARRGAVGVLPVIALIEYAHKFHLPNNLYNNHSMEKLRRLVVDFIIIQNDIISYPKEEAEGVTHNIITIFRASGMTTQQAFDEAGKMLCQCERDWILAIANLPTCDGEVETEASQKYVTACKATISANLHWQFKSERYLGDLKDFARLYRIVMVNAEPVLKSQSQRADIVKPFALRLGQLGGELGMKHEPTMSFDLVSPPMESQLKYLGPRS